MADDVFSQQPSAQQLASDNYSGICPAAWAAMKAANSGDAFSYGDDPWTAAACERLREVFESDCEVFFVATGTAANALSLATLCKPYQAVVAHCFAHIETDERGAPEFFTNGSKLLLCHDPAGKLRTESVDALVGRRQDVHYPNPAVVSLTQATEMGTLYSMEELRAIAACARRNGLRLHLDGARFANAVAALGVAPHALTAALGVDVLCFCGAKNGLGLGDAVVFFNRDLAEEFAFRCKQAGQLLSKMRFVAAQWQGLLEGDTWLANARHANAMARLLARRVAEEAELQPLYPVQANAVFLDLPAPVLAALSEKGWRLYTFIGGGGTRLMCAWDTREETVERFARDLAAVSATV